MGIEVARVIMNHSERSTLHHNVYNQYYSRGTNNLQLVNMRMGKIKGSNESAAGEALMVSLSQNYNHFATCLNTHIEKSKSSPLQRISD